LPYTLLLGEWLRTFSEATTAALRQIVPLVPVARAVEFGDGSLFQVQYATEPFIVSVGSACAGVNGSVGFLLIGGAIAGAVRGNVFARLAWLIVGLALTWALNVVRIMVIFAAGAAQGQEFAIDALHPFFGLVTFNAGVVAMVLALPLFRLGWHSRRAGPSDASPRDAGGVPVRVAPLAVTLRRGFVGLAIVVSAAVVAGSVNSDREHELVVADLGQPRLSGFSPVSAQVDGWTPSLSNSYPWVRQYFGDESTWNRWTYLAATNTANPERPPAYVTVDVITTYDLSSFAAYGLEACYGFHNYRLLETERVDLGGGVSGKAIVYYNPTTRTNWTAVYWEWPVDIAGRELYERLILNASSSYGAELPPVEDASDPIADLQYTLASLLGGPTGDLDNPELIATRDLLIGFGRAVVQSRAEATLGSAAP
jgi:exosortase/archaeosortase family protein